MSTLASLGGWALAGLVGMAVVLVRRTLHDRMEAVARACHELRGPLAAARLGLTSGSRGGGLSPGRLRAIDTELGRAALALDDLAGVRDGILRLWALDRVDVAELVADAVEAGRAGAEAAGKTLRLRRWGEVGEAAVWGDRLRLAQALGNLVGNAVEHGGGEIEVRVTRVLAAGRIRIEVADDGAGLPAPVAELARRARRGRGRRGRGLAIAAGVAAAHGGRLVAAPSERGARVVLELPAARGMGGAGGVAGAQTGLPPRRLPVAGSPRS